MKHINKNNYQSFLNSLFIIGIIWLVISSITTVMYVQFVWLEIPCTLCLFQRLSLFGIGIAALLQLTTQPNVKYKSFGLMLFFMILLQIIGTTHSLLTICPRPDHPWLNPPVFGVRLPIWSFTLGTTLSLAVAMNFIFLQGDKLKTIHNYPVLYKIARFSALILIILLVINLLAIFSQCQFGHCHTNTYKILNYFK